MVVLTGRHKLNIIPPLLPFVLIIFFLALSVYAFRLHLQLGLHFVSVRMACVVLHCRILPVHHLLILPPLCAFNSSVFVCQRSMLCLYSAVFLECSFVI